MAKVCTYLRVIKLNYAPLKSGIFQTQENVLNHYMNLPQPLECDILHHNKLLWSTVCNKSLF